MPGQGDSLVYQPGWPALLSWQAARHVHCCPAHTWFATGQKVTADLHCLDACVTWLTVKGMQDSATSGCVAKLALLLSWLCQCALQWPFAGDRAG